MLEFLEHSLRYDKNWCVSATRLCIGSHTDMEFCIVEIHCKISRFKYEFVAPSTKPLVAPEERNSSVLGQKLPVDTKVDLLYVPLDMVFARFDSLCHSVASNPSAVDAYVKKPRISLYMGNNSVATLMSREAQICELLKLHPHPNIVEYRGVVYDGEARITGLCLKKYQTTLFIRVTRAAKQPLKVDAWLAGIRRAIDHLHSLGFCHNDVMPGNIMLDEDDNAVLIDFDAADADNAKPERALKLAVVVGVFPTSKGLARAMIFMVSTWLRSSYERNSQRNLRS
eukprot:IDg4802t1